MNLKYWARYLVCYKSSVEAIMLMTYNLYITYTPLLHLNYRYICSHMKYL